MTLTDLYPEWLDYKSQLTNSPNTIAVHEKHWNKYFKDTSLFLKPISTITLKDLNLWANALIKMGFIISLSFIILFIIHTIFIFQPLPISIAGSKRVRHKDLRVSPFLPGRLSWRIS